MGRNLFLHGVSRLGSASLLVVLVAAASGCHTVPVAPAVVTPASLGTVRILGAVPLPQVATIPPQGLTLAGALELAGGILPSPEFSKANEVAAPAGEGAAGEVGGGGTPLEPADNDPPPVVAAPAPTAIDPDTLLIGLRRIVNNVPNTTFFAVPLVLKYDAGLIPLQDGDQVRVVPYTVTGLVRRNQILNTPDAPLPEITVFSGTPLNAVVRALDSNAELESYFNLAQQIDYDGDPTAFAVMQSLTRVNPNDNGVETYIIPKNVRDVVSVNPFPQFDSDMQMVMKTQPGDVFGLTTLPQVAAIAVPKLTDATNTLLDLARSAQDPAESESRLRRSLYSLRQGQIPQAPTLPTMPTLPRSLDLPDPGIIRTRLGHSDGLPYGHKRYKKGVVGTRRNLDESNRDVRWIEEVVAPQPARELP